MSNYSKLIASVLGAIVAGAAVLFGQELPISNELITSLSLALGPILVLFFPANAPPE